MEQKAHSIHIRFVELLLAIPLWETYGSAACWSDCVETFVHQSELTQVGTITIVMIVTKAIVRIVAHARNETVEIWKESRRNATNRDA